MQYSPQHSQPFSLDEAISFDIPVIVEEIDRLENSLKHLKSTQEILQCYLSGTHEPDIELSDAREENNVVIQSQEERIGILKMALTAKGVRSEAHYHGSTKPTQLGVSETANSEGSGIHL